ncbi:hypothetical protein EBI00_02560 [Marinomonas hwangdonensis]|uniref:Uncharacterized protein n=1 Tax=Marinomonas hwangdonensis TaxID=1053647 RepID=A0A3M8QBI8_9GAMM|nr:hypothetical protein [Marinomonas hwangdonensis]RNF53002.1 hypothetical protein EBI00_02560 [Marinomonas hwangdonensis]
MSFGLGYLADGFLKGQERNRNWGLRQKQEERSQAADQRAQESHGIGMRIGGVNAAMAEEKMTPEAITQRQEMAGIGLDAARQSLTNAKAQGIGIQQQNTAREIELSPEYQNFKQQSQEQSIRAAKLDNQYKEYRNTEAGQKVSEEALAWDKRISDIVNQKDEALAQVQLAEALDMKRYRMIQLIKSGDPMGAAMMVNMSKDNKFENVATFDMTKDGGIIGYDTSGNEVASIPAQEVKGVIERVKSRQPADKESKITMVPIYNDMGDKIGERPAITETDSATGEQYIKYLEERDEDPDVIKLARLMVAAGTMTVEEFEEDYGPYGQSGQTQATNPQRQAAPDPYSVGIPRPKPAPTTPTQPGGILQSSSVNERYSRSVPLDPNASLYR